MKILRNLISSCLIICRFLVYWSFSFSIAYEILSDSDKRRQYDQFGDAAFGAGGGAGAGGSSFNFNDFFRGFDDAFGAHQRGGRSDRKFHFGHENTGSFFDFGDLFEDDDADDPFGNMFNDFNSFSFSNVHTNVHSDGFHQVHTSSFSSSSQGKHATLKTLGHFLCHCLNSLHNDTEN